MRLKNRTPATTEAAKICQDLLHFPLLLHFSFFFISAGYFESSTELTKAEAVLDKIAESELGKLQGKGVEFGIDSSVDSEASVMASSEGKQ